MEQGDQDKKLPVMNYQSKAPDMPASLGTLDAKVFVIAFAVGLTAVAAAVLWIVGQY